MFEKTLGHGIPSPPTTICLIPSHSTTNFYIWNIPALFAEFRTFLHYPPYSNTFDNSAPHFEHSNRSHHYPSHSNIFHHILPLSPTFRTFQHYLPPSEHSSTILHISTHSTTLRHISNIPPHPTAFQHIPLLSATFRTFHHYLPNLQAFQQIPLHYTIIRHISNLSSTFHHFTKIFIVLHNTTLYLNTSLFCAMGQDIVK